VVGSCANLATAGYDLATVTSDFLENRIATPCQALNEDLRHLAGDGGLAEEVRHGCRGLAVAVRGVLVWYDRFRFRVACEPLDLELARLKYHTPVLAALQGVFPGPEAAAACAGGSCGA
jgi:hypothetical protein